MKLKPLAEQMMMNFWLDDDESESTSTLPAVAEVIQLVPHLPTEAVAEVPVIEIAKPVVQKPAKAVWPRLEASLFANLSGAVTKYEANIKAIELLRKLEEENRNPNDEERLVLNQYTGWGGLPQAFNENQKEESWVERAQQLKGLLSEDEYKSANASTPNAHYTSVEVIEAMWAMVERLGFKGGRILEPAVGTGYFLGAMPEKIAQQSQVTAVELDDLSARFVKAMYGSYGVDVLQGGFESFKLPNNYYDLAIGNVPFGSYQVAELRNLPYKNYLIHDYFFAKSMDLVRPGGIVAFITSSGTMDKVENQVRRYLASKADLVAAVRLPNTAFKKIANTEVTTDILIFKKPLAGKTVNRDWMDWSVVPSDSPIYSDVGYVSYQQYNRVACNKYFINNPQQVIGKLGLVSNGYGKVTGCIFDGDLAEALHERVELIPEGIYTTRSEDTEKNNVVKLAIADEHRPGYRVIDGKVYEVVGSEALLYQAAQKVLDRIRGLVSIRDAARKLVHAQPKTDDDNLLHSYRVSLGMAYDAFVSKHGFIHAKMNKQAFKADPDLPLLLSLEIWDEEKQVAEKADIFHRRTVGIFKRVEKCETPQEALLVSISETGKVNVNRIGQLLGKPGEEAMTDLEDLGAVYLNPETELWESADVYLSGNVREKLAAAKVSGERYTRNAQALETVIPADLAPHEIGARIGSTWIPALDYEAFLNETLDGKSNKISFNELAGTWDLEADHQCNYSVASTQVYGTSRINAVALFTLSLNQMVPTIYDADPRDSDKRVVNQTETIAAREKQQELKDKFVEWLWSDDERSNRLVRLYNDIFNSVVQRRYDGKHLVLPGFLQAYYLHGHQGDAVWRTVSSGRNTLLAHAVGAGKTLEMICSGMELRRLGKASKPMFVCPNHMLEQFASEFLRAYPGANILMAGKEDLQGDKRRALLSRIATGDWDAVLITHASFERIPMSDDFMAEYIQSEIDMIEDAIRSEKQSRGNRIVKELARAKKTWEARLAKLSAKEKKDDLLTFEELGIDWLFVDEAHLFKNLFRFTKMSRIAGLPNSNSERSFDMFVKTRYIMEKHNGAQGVVFATGTPVSNSMAEMWVMQRFLQPKTLSAYQVSSFDTWAGNFGESVTSLELSPDGAGYRMQTRFARFVNLPELMSIFGEVADIRTAEMLNLPVPKFHKETVTAKPSPELRSYVQTLVARAEKIKSGQVKPSEDNMLAVTNDGRLAALDMRLVYSMCNDEPGSKVNLCVQNVHRIWEDSKGTQLVFSDLSTPNKNGGFSVYTDIRDKLIALGVPANEIAFIHDYDSDAAKGELFKAVREGRVRILLGSTSKMGVGTNVQTKLIALHHLDAPWRPSDVEQREGRIIRQGNQNEEVWIYRYVTEASFDAYLWQTLETKARFIAQVMQGDTGMRSAEDVELAALSYAEVKALASGNPLVMEKAGVDTELAKLSLLKSKWNEQQWRNKSELSHMPDVIARTKRRIAAIESDISHRQDVSGPNFVIEVDGRRFRDRVDAGKALMAALHGVRRDTKEVIGSISGFPIVGISSFLENRMVLSGGIEYDVGKADSALGFAKVVENALNRMESVLEHQNEHLATQVKRMSDIMLELNKPFEKQDRLDWLQNRQREIENALDLSKGDMAAVEEAPALEAA